MLSSSSGYPSNLAPDIDCGLENLENIEEQI